MNSEEKQNKKFLYSSVLFDMVIEQITLDVQQECFLKIYELLSHIPLQYLFEYLPEDTQSQWKLEQKHEGI